jgi:hypothetical protein
MTRLQHSTGQGRAGQGNLCMIRLREVRFGEAGRGKVFVFEKFLARVIHSILESACSMD